MDAGYKPAQRDSLYGIVKEPAVVLAEYQAALSRGGQPGGAEPGELVAGAGPQAPRQGGNSGAGVG